MCLPPRDTLENFLSVLQEQKKTAWKKIFFLAAGEVSKSAVAVTQAGKKEALLLSCRLENRASPIFCYPEKSKEAIAVEFLGGQNTKSQWQYFTVARFFVEKSSQKSKDLENWPMSLQQ